MGVQSLYGETRLDKQFYSKLAFARGFARVILCLQKVANRNASSFTGKAFTLTDYDEC